jgi:outer membrane protein assembly factor BamB/formylglycine-generating enzyme required for sulfatase activity
MNMFIFWGIAGFLFRGQGESMKTFFSQFALFCLILNPLHAENFPVIDFGDDYAWHGGLRGLPIYRATAATLLYPGSRDGENTVDVDGDGETKDDSIAYYPFSLEETLNPTGSFYNDKGLNSRFYGGLTSYFANRRPRWSEGGINLDHNLRDDFNLHSYATEGGDVAVKTFGLWLWQKEDFLSDGDRLPVAVDADSRIAVYISRYWKEYEEGRFVIREGDTLYISEFHFTGSLHTLFSLSPLESRWAEYHPKAPYDIGFNPKNADFSFRKFENITAAGWYVAKPTLGPAALWLKWNAFSLKAVVDKPLPAPGAIGKVSYALWRNIYSWSNRNQTGIYPPYVYDRDGDMGNMATLQPSVSAQEPVTDITWLDALLWCNAYSEHSGLKPLFYEDAALTNVLRVGVNRIDPDQVDWRPEVFIDSSADGFRPVLQGEGDSNFAGLQVARHQAGKNISADAAIAFWKQSIQPLNVQAVAGPPQMKMVKIPGGEYLRKDGADVLISPFEMAATEITYSQWMRVYAYAQSKDYAFDRDGDRGSMDWSSENESFGLNEPVTQISHLDAMLWCNALSEMEGKQPVYMLDAAKTQVMREARRFRIENSPIEQSHHQIKNKGVQDVFVRWEADGYRLPTSWEWMYAYRAGNSAQDQYPWGKDPITNHAWVGANSNDRTHPVGSKSPNAFGLYDLAGNVFEWTMGGGGSYYRIDNPRGKGWPVPLGGSFRTDEKESPLMMHMGGSPRVAIHSPLPKAYSEIGFRVIRCEAGVHPAEPPPYVAKTVLNLPAESPDLQGQLWRGNSGRTGEFPHPGPVNAPRAAWTFSADKPFQSSPVVFEGTVYAGNDNGKVYAVDAKTGTLKWEADLGAPVRSSPAIFENKVFINNPKGVFALDRESGAVLWQKNGGFWDDSPLVISGPMQDKKGQPIKGVVFASLPWKGMLGLAVSPGAAVWQHRDGHGPGRNGSSALFHQGDIIFFRGSQATVVVDAATERRRFEIDGGVDSGVFTPVAKDNMCYSYIRGIVGFTLDDGDFPKDADRISWRFLPPSEEDWDTQHPGISSLAVDREAVYFGHRNRYVYALNKDTGTLKWKTQTGGSVGSSPALGSTGLLYVGCDDASVYALDKASGAVRWKFPLKGAIQSSPALFGNMLFVGSNDGNLYGIVSQ